MVILVAVVGLLLVLCGSSAVACYCCCMCESVVCVCMLAYVCFLSGNCTVEFLCASFEIFGYLC